MEGFDIGMLPPDIQDKLMQIVTLTENREPQGEVSYERLIEMNAEVYEIRKRLLKSQYDGAITATDNLIEGLEKETNTETKTKTLKAAVVSLETMIDSTKKELMQSLLMQKLEGRKKVRRGINGAGEDLDMLDTIINMAEKEADYNPAEVQRRREEASKPTGKPSVGFGFGSNRA